MTGGRGGIGGACAAWLEARGRQVVIVDKAEGHDACDPDSVTGALGGVDRIDVVVHAAGSVGAGGIDEAEVGQWRAVLEDNLLSALVTAQVCLPLMGRGSSMVLLSSVNGRSGGNRLSGPAYAAAKAGLLGLTRHLARDQAHRGIRVNAIAPGPVATAMLDRLARDEVEALRAAVPLGRIATADEIAEAVGWISSDAAPSMTGAVLDINGGLWMG
ncbi:SDR family NAD(P)-dependent oxidoreductase [uncultured Aeromicrobium sp.]|uniref:SDR family NAD(P)-dependent oxidoreductase n=1 Tax=uncultured Aeromicrobium sp. TaxID=337820 RepID=UPI0025D9091B|nr:SDR family oxidoreductase [uncultured Aeromicrobium sp.]